MKTQTNNSVAKAFCDTGDNFVCADLRMINGINSINIDGLLMIRGIY